MLVYYMWTHIGSHAHSNETEIYVSNRLIMFQRRWWRPHSWVLVWANFFISNLQKVLQRTPLLLNLMMRKHLYTVSMLNVMVKWMEMQPSATSKMLMSQMILLRLSPRTTMEVARAKERLNGRYVSFIQWICGYLRTLCTCWCTDSSFEKLNFIQNSHLC